MTHDTRFEGPMFGKGATAYEQWEQRVEARIAALESRRELTQRDIDWIATVKHHGDQIDGLLERVGALENIEELAMSLDELRRQERWHATRDAVLPAIYAEALNQGMCVEEVLHDAALYADAAHGKLKPEGGA